MQVDFYFPTLWFPCFLFSFSIVKPLSSSRWLTITHDRYANIQELPKVSKTNSKARSEKSLSSETHLIFFPKQSSSQSDKCHQLDLVQESWNVNYFHTSHFSWQNAACSIQLQWITHVFLTKCILKIGQRSKDLNANTFILHFKGRSN